MQVQKLRTTSYFLISAVFGIVSATASRSEPVNIAGSWNGPGTVSLPSGNTERVRCRATFNQSGTRAFMNATCASSSTRVRQTAELQRAGNRFTGEFFNEEYGVSGRIRITVNGNSMSASLSGGGGSGTFDLSR